MRRVLEDPTATDNPRCSPLGACRSAILGGRHDSLPELSDSTVAVIWQLVKDKKAQELEFFFIFFYFKEELYLL